MSIWGRTQNENLRSRSECQFEATLGTSIWGNTRNVSLRSRSECQFEVTQASLICSLHEDVGTIFLGDEGRGGKHGWAFTTYVFADQVQKRVLECIANAGRQLWEKTAKKSVHRRNQEKKKDFKSRKHILQTLHMPGIRLTLHVAVVLYCLLDSH